MWSIAESLQLIDVVQMETFRIKPDLSTDPFDIVDWNNIVKKLNNRTADDCKDNWYQIVREFFSITNYFHPDPNKRNRRLFAIKWLVMEQLTFLIPYMEKYTRTGQEEETVIVPPEKVEKKEKDEYDTFTLSELKETVNEMLAKNPQLEFAEKLLANVRSICHVDAAKRGGYCKVYHRMDIITRQWTRERRYEFIHWYYYRLLRLVNRKSRESTQNATQ